MAIVYDKLFKVLEDHGITTYTIKKTGLIAQATLYRIKNGTGGLDNRTLDRLCRELQCQPGDLMEWVPDPDEQDTSAAT